MYKISKKLLKLNSFFSNKFLKNYALRKQSSKDAPMKYMQTKNKHPQRISFSNETTVYDPTKNEPAGGIIMEGPFLMAAFQNNTLLQSVRKYPHQNLEPHRNQSINLLCKSTDSFRQDKGFYGKVFASRFL